MVIITRALKLFLNTLDPCQLNKSLFFNSILRKHRVLSALAERNDLGACAVEALTHITTPKGGSLGLTITKMRLNHFTYIFDNFSYFAKNFRTYFLHFWIHYILDILIPINCENFGYVSNNVNCLILELIFKLKFFSILCYVDLFNILHDFFTVFFHLCIMASIFEFCWSFT